MGNTGRFISSHGRTLKPCFTRNRATLSAIFLRYSSGAYVFRVYHSRYLCTSRGNFSCRNGRNTFEDDGVKNRTPEVNHCAPASCAASATASKFPSRSVIPGSNGDAKTPTEIPASRNCFTAASLAAGSGARGSSNRANLLRTVVIVIFTNRADLPAIPFNKSTSRKIWFDF